MVGTVEWSTATVETSEKKDVPDISGKHYVNKTAFRKTFAELLIDILCV